MGFLDPKERVMEIILTEYGRQLLSKGKLQAKYYRFFDDEVDYQTQNITILSENLGNEVVTEAGESITTEDGDALILE